MPYPDQTNNSLPTSIMPPSSSDSQTPPSIQPPANNPLNPPSDLADESEVSSPFLKPQAPEEFNSLTDIPPVIATRDKPKKAINGRVVTTLLTLLILVGGVVAGALLVRERQTIEQKAINDCASNCLVGQFCYDECIPDQTGYSRSVSCSSDGQKIFGSSQPDSTCNAQQTPVNADNYVSADNYSCTPATCQTRGCNNSCTANLSGYSIYWSGSTYTVPSGCYSIKNKCARVNNISRGAEACFCPTNHITDVYGQGYDTCDLPDIERYFVRGLTTNGWDSNFCGTEQVDINCGGNSYYHSIADLSPAVCSTPTPTPVPTPTPTSTAKPTATPTSTPTPEPIAQCINIKAYDLNWKQLSVAELSSLKAGDKVRFAVSGQASSGIFDKAKFKINGVERSEVFTKKPGTEEFYDEYTLSAGAVSFTINALLHHSTLGWF
jgi:hypothetical protein